MSYYDDVPIGVRRDLGSHTFRAEEIVAFARKFDPQRFHLSDEEAAKTHFGRLCASGWHTGSIWMRLNTETWQREIKAYIEAGNDPPRLGPSPGFENLTWTRPVFAGDTLRTVVEVIAARESRSKPDRGLVTFGFTSYNQNDEVVMTYTCMDMIRREPKE